MNSKKSFYCWYLGFTEAYGLQGQNRVYEVIQNILKYHQKDNINKVKHSLSNIVSSSKVTLALSDSNLKIIDNTIIGQKKFFKKDNQQIVSKSYAISYENITYVCRLTNQPYSDIVTFITKSLPDMDTRNSSNGKLSLFLHAFRFDSDETAIKMERYLTQYLRLYNKKLEKKNKINKNNNLIGNYDLYNEIGHLHNSNLKNSFLNRQGIRTNAQLRTSNDNSSGGGTRSSSSNDLLDTTNESGNLNLSGAYPPVSYNSRPTSPLHLEFANVNKEFENKLKSERPILFPPKDYNADDRQRGNFNDLNSRRSQNPLIVGHEAHALNLIKNKYNHVKKVNAIKNSEFISSSFNEQAQEAIKLLDDIVDSELLSQPDYEIEHNIYKYKPSNVNKASFRTNFQNLKYPNMSASMENLSEKNQLNFYKNYDYKSNSMEAGLDDSYFDNRGQIKTNPLLAIEEEPYSPPKNINQSTPQVFRSAVDLNNEASQGKNLFFQKKTKLSKKSNNEENIENNYNVLNSGFRSGAYPILNSYQPRWMSSSSKEKSSEFVYSKNQSKHKETNVKNIKLKHSESDKVNRTTENQKIDFRPPSSAKTKLFVKKNLPRVNENGTEYSENSEFILKPSNFVNSNSKYYNQGLNNRMKNSASYYKSESSLAPNRYNFNDFYY